jgi:hypothetical protein
MRALRFGLIVIAVLSVGVHVSPAAARSVGQVIDDTVVTTEVKAKLTADKLSNLTKPPRRASRRRSRQSPRPSWASTQRVSYRTSTRQPAP